MNLLKKIFRTHITHKFKYKSFGDVKDQRRRCPYCKQWFDKRTIRNESWYEPVNGIILNPNCTCHHWKKAKRKD